MPIIRRFGYEKILESPMSKKEKEKIENKYYSFNCKSCKEHINFKNDQIYKVVANYKCALCSADNWIDPNSNNFQEIEEEIFNVFKMPLIKKGGSKPLNNVKNSNQNSIESSKSRNYPALIFLSKFANFIAWLGVISFLVGYLIYIDSLYRPELGEVLFPLFAIILATFILFIFWRAISEILILFVDIAKDVREIRLKK
jgi:hypothetical protein